MASDTWLGSDPRVEIVEEEIPEIIGYRRANHADIPRICQMMRIKTRDLFGDVDAGQVFESACLSLVQINDDREVISNVSLCNFPNVPSVPANDWLAWITMHYGVPGVIERNTLFIHLLVWDGRYNETFFKIMLNDVFAITFYCLHVIMIVPPNVKSEAVEMFDRHMTRFHPRDETTSSNMVQTLYVSLRHQEDPKLNIRRVVEEDNDDLIPIINAESPILRELYGDYYISEMMRHPEDGIRQLIVAENEGLATGVMCLNRIFKLDLLIENFELAPYNDLRKSIPSSDESLSSKTISSSTSTSSSVITKTASEVLDTDNPKERERERFSQAINKPSYENETRGESNPEGSAEPILKSTKSSDRRSRISPSVNFESVLRTSVFAEAIKELPIRTLASSAYNDDDELGLSQFSEKTERNPSSQSTQPELNAFTLELFSMDKKIDERHGQDYLEAAFECFPDLDYCVMLIPTAESFFTFLEHFVRVPLRFDRDFPMVLYVTHRATQLGFLKCREAIPYDREMLVDFLQGIPKKKVVLEDFDEAMKYPRGGQNCYVFLCENKIIGLAILCSETHIDELCTKYNVEDYISMKNTSRDAHAQLLHCIVVPIFTVYHRYLFRELMRLHSATVLYYRLYDNETTALHRTRPLPTCLDAMIPVNSRIRIHHPYLRLNEKTNVTNGEKFALFLTTPRLAMMGKPVINSKIVVVGASDCGVAFAEYLAFQGSSSNIVHFTNLTIVSPNGIPFEGKGNIEHATMIPFRGKYCYEYRKFVPSRVWINVVHGFLSHINRKEKFITVSGLGILSYDYLVLTCGLQYHIPNFQDDREPEKKRIGQENIPLNCFCINDDVDAATCLERLRELTNDFTTKKFIVIYGRNIECHCTLNTLLESGIKGSWLILIEPKLGLCGRSSDIFFEDDEISIAVENSIRESGVKIISGWDLTDWILEIGENFGKKDNDRTSVIRSLRIESKTEKKIITCDALIYFGDKMIPMKTFMAISRAGLVFDGRLVIDTNYRTNDPYIYAAGAITKYSRKNAAESWQHQYYDSIEVGERLAKWLKQTINSHSKHYDKNTNPKVNDVNKNKSTNIPVFRSPILVYCRLPGGLHYLHVRKPGKKISRVVDIVRGIYGEVFITGNALDTSKVGYFRIRLNPFNRVETITCLRKEDFRIQDLITLYGKHDSMLNNLKLHFQNSLISDLFAYFAEPWAAALYHDKFDCLRVENRATLLSETGIRGDTLIQDVLTACVESNWKEVWNYNIKKNIQQLKEEYRRYIESRYAGSVYQDAISSNLINFLQAEEEILPMYCNPRKLRRQLMKKDD